MNGTTRSLAVGALLTLGALSACGGSKTDAGRSSQAAAESPSGAAVASAEITPEAHQQAQQIFSTRCAVCHGAEGRGDGPGGAGLDPRPRNYHDTAWQDSVTDKEIEQAIVYGGAAVGRSPAMVANPDLGSKPAIVAALREIVRNFGKEK
ncbi:MAG: c-type cytochrome [Gemmatimonadetes bacterium]|nr:c-type cytochrome [Gemmatimonadota bacterium]